MNLNELNDIQTQAVLCTEGAVMVTAGAGSGKTRLLTHRIAFLVKEKNVSPYNILAITFTNKAANEMKERLSDMLDLLDPRDLWVSTFHSMCVRILRKYISEIDYTSNFSIYAEDEKERIIKSILKKRDLDAEQYLKRCIFHIGKAKNSGHSADEHATLNKHEDDIDAICAVYRDYAAELKNNNALDYDDLLVNAFKVLSTCADAREHYQNRFKYIHVDEFQDTNTIQYKLVKILALKYRNIFVVGDEDQCIYGWRGANIENIMNFKEDFNATVFKLEQNYRSTKSVLNLANKLIVNNIGRIEKNLWTDNDEGAPIEHIVATSESNEADNILFRINKLVSENNYKYSDIAILMRLNALTRSFEEKLVQYAIPYKIFGGFKFFERKEVKDILAYLKIMANPRDNEAVIRVINFPRRGVGDGTVAQLINYAEVSDMCLTQVLEDVENNPDLPISIIKKVAPFALFLKTISAKKDSLNAVEFVRYVVDMLHVDEIFDIDTEDGRSRLANIQEFVNSVKAFCDSNEVATLDNYLQMITLYTDLDDMNETNNCVKIATIHSAKGLEFKAVFIVGLEENIFPISRASDSPDQLEEERRLLYVAITRAREKLYISRATTRFLYGQRKPAAASRFLKELGVEVPRTVRYGNIPRPAAPPSPRIIPTEMPIATAQTGLDISKVGVGSKLSHRKFGLGNVISLNTEHNGIYAVIEFDKVGKLTLALNFAPLTVVE